jgi:hypothetical protein
VEDGHEAAYERYKHAWPYITAGKPVPPMKDDGQTGDYQTLDDSINLFLESCDNRVQSGELSARMLTDYATTARLLLEAVDRNRDIETLGPDDFAAIRAELGEGRALQTLANHVTRTRSMFKWIVEAGLRETPINFGPDFRKPHKRRIELEAQDRGDKGFTADEVRKLLKTASMPMRAMLLLGINAAYGNTDIALLDRRHVRLNDGLLVVPRSKTASPRRAALWPETREAIKQALEREDERVRKGGPLSDDAVDAVFVTKYGNRWRRFEVGEDMKPTGTDAVGLAFGRLMDKAKLRRDGRGFYGLRHTFRRAADTHHDRPAADLVMGHAPKDMRGNYVPPEAIEAERVRAVCDHVRAWLWPPPAKKKTTKKRSRRSARK